MEMNVYKAQFADGSSFFVFLQKDPYDVIGANSVTDFAREVKDLLVEEDWGVDGIHISFTAPPDIICPPDGQNPYKCIELTDQERSAFIEAFNEIEQ